MSEAQKAAEAYVKETDYIDNLNRNLAGNAFLAGAAWQRKRDAAIAEKFVGDLNTLTCCKIAQAIRSQTCDETHVPKEKP